MRPKKSFFSKYHEEIVSYAILAVPLILWGVFFLYAFITVFYNSFTDWSVMEVKNFIWFENYIEIFKDEVVIKAIVNTVIWTFFVTIGTNAMGLFTVMLIIKFKKQGIQRLFLTLLFWPTLVSAAVSANIQKLIFAPDSSGLVNSILMGLGIIQEPLGWFYDPNLALWALMFTPFFLGFGTKMIIYYAGVKNIPKQYYEACALETNSKCKTFWHITFPLLMPVVMFNLILSVIDGFKVIAPMQLVTDGKPLNSTMSIMLSIYKNAFEYDQYGYASAIGFVAFIIIMAITLVQFKLDKGKVSYE